MNRFLLELLICCYFLNFLTLIRYAVTFVLLYQLARLAKFVCNQYTLPAAVQKIKKQRQINLDAALAYGRTILDAKLNLIREADYPKIRELLRNREISCTDVLKTYIILALQATETTNSVIAFIDWAKNVAEDLDELLQTPDFDMDKYPLFGLPLSVKESTPIKNHPQTCGFLARTHKKAEKNANLIENLIENGAIPFCLTNVPQSLLTFECDNPLFGATTHPQNKTRTSGGSSGGEAALITSGGSLVGFGSDLGGSIRIPAHFSGCVGIKPGSTRLSCADALKVVPGRPYVKCAEGPLGQNVDVCVKVLSTLVDGQESKQDFQVPPVPWRKTIYENLTAEKLKIGYFCDNGWFQPCPAVMRAVSETAEKLEQSGHELVEFSPPQVGKAFQLMMGAVNVDGGSFLLNLFAQDLVMKEYIPLLAPLFMPHLLRSILANTVGRLYPRVGVLLRMVASSPSHLQQIFADIQDYQRLFERAMKDQGIDLILCPPCAAVATKLNETLSLTPAFCYTNIFNLLDYPAGVVPVTRVTSDDVSKMRDYPVTDNFSKLFKQSMSSEDTKDLPVGVQVAGPPYSEELICRVLREIEAFSSFGSK